ncbi:MAG: hypothetical protein NW216_09640 [Hyphomicrobium sp.]|nr:hypothetical protein [Hyphomicrobium sp.]
MPRLLPLWPHEIAVDTIAGRVRLIEKLESALRAERRRGLMSHWSYDLARHAQLFAACREERAALAAIQESHRSTREGTA